MNNMKVTFIDPNAAARKADELLSTALHALYTLEDMTNYENKNISEAVNLLQREIKYYLCINDDTRLNKLDNGWQCPACGCFTTAPEEDGMERIEE